MQATTLPLGVLLRNITRLIGLLPYLWRPHHGKRRSERGTGLDLSPSRLAALVLVSEALSEPAHLYRRQLRSREV